MALKADMQGAGQEGQQAALSGAHHVYDQGRAM